MMKKALINISLAMAAVLLFLPFQSFAGKQEARDFATGASVLGGLAVATGVGAAPGAGAVVGQGVGYIWLGVWDLFATAPARPNPNHGVIASVTPVVFTPVAGSGLLVDRVNSSLVLAGKVTDDSRLLGSSLERYYGALLDGNSVNAAAQRLSASEFLFRLEEDLISYRNALVAMSAGVAGTDFASLSTTVAETLSLRYQIVSSGFPSFESHVFSEMNATADELANAILEVGLVTGDSLSDADLTGAVIFDNLALALGKVDMRELLPRGFSVVSEPETAWLMVLGFMGLFCATGGSSAARLLGFLSRVAASRAIPA